MCNLRQHILISNTLLSSIAKGVIIMNRNKILICLLVSVFFLCTLLQGCTRAKDTTVKVDALELDMANVQDICITYWVNDVYNNVEEMMIDAKYIVEGTVENIDYYVEDNEGNIAPRTKVDLRVKKSYTNNIKPNTLISIIEMQGYVPLELYAKNIVKATGHLPPPFTSTDIENHLMLRFVSNNGVFSNVGDQCLYFLIDIDTPSTDTHVFGRKDTNIPDGAYKPLGILMGKFTLQINSRGDNYYRRNNPIYYSAQDLQRNDAPTLLERTIVKDELISQIKEHLKSE